MVRFISIAYVVLKSKNFSLLFVLIQHPWNGPFLGFFGLYSPKYCLILLKLLPEVVSNKKNSVWKILQNLEFWLKWNVVKVSVVVKVTVSVHIGAHFTTGKPKILLKAKISAKTASLGIINNVSLRSQKNHRILVKLR